MSLGATPDGPGTAVTHTKILYEFGQLRQSEHAFLQSWSEIVSGKSAIPSRRSNICQPLCGPRDVAVGVVTPDPASVESVITWAHALQYRVDYLIVKNALTEPADFSYSEQSQQAEQFRQAFHPQEISMEYRLAKFENPARQHGVTLGQAAERKVAVPELQQTTVGFARAGLPAELVWRTRPGEEPSTAMSQSSANGVARATPDALASLAGRLPDPQDREWFARLVSYIDSLPANDEFVKVAQLFGFLTLIGRELPEPLAEERKQLREMLSEAYTALQQEIKTNAGYHE